MLSSRELDQCHCKDESLLLLSPACIRRYCRARGGYVCDGASTDDICGSTAEASACTTVTDDGLCNCKGAVRCCPVRQDAPPPRLHTNSPRRASIVSRSDIQDMHRFQGLVRGGLQCHSMSVLRHGAAAAAGTRRLQVAPGPGCLRATIDAAANPKSLICYGFKQPPNDVSTMPWHCTFTRETYP